ncbi:MAG: hypothetical protein K6F77_03665 [Lachnospiraceae bacterium]|nr:hypothetical protein [Lachnospiraceae bacterium]
MSNSKSSKFKLAIASIMSIAILAFVLFSAFFIAEEIHHDCCGEDCPICACLEQCENTLTQICDGLVAQFAVIIPVVSLLLAIIILDCQNSSETLVSKKVRLDD